MLVDKCWAGAADLSSSFIFDKEQKFQLFDYIFVVGSAKRDDPRQNSKARETVNVVHLSTFSVPVQQNIQQVDRR